MRKTVIEETRTVCISCGGRGQESTHGYSTSTLGACRGCQGSGQVLVSTVTRHEEFNLDELADAVCQRMLRNLTSASRLISR